MGGFSIVMWVKFYQRVTLRNVTSGDLFSDWTIKLRSCPIFVIVKVEPTQDFVVLHNLTGPFPRGRGNFLRLSVQAPEIHKFLRSHQLLHLVQPLSWSGRNSWFLQGFSPVRNGVQLVNIIFFNKLVYDTQITSNNYIFRWGYKPTNITFGGPILYGSMMSHDSKLW